MMTSLRYLTVLVAVLVPVTASAAEPAALDLGVGERLLVVAPHPDDESLGAGGLIQRVLNRDGSARVVIMTAGDGYVEAVEHETGLLWPRPSQYIDYGERRLKEVKAAVHELGGDRVRFDLLAFPDGGLRPLLHAHWRRTHPERSMTTGVSHPPYPEAEDQDLRYDGADLRDKLVSLLRELEPTVVAFPEPLDKHPDHSAAGIFTMLAIDDWAGVDAKHPAPMPRLLAYLVHWKDWPDWPDAWDQHTPPPYRPAPPLILPTSLPDRGLKRVVLPLADEELDRKTAALACHQTQQEVIPYLLAAFERRTEPFTVFTAAELRRAEQLIERSTAGKPAPARLTPRAAGRPPR